MANTKAKAKSGMEGRGSRTVRWAKRHEVKAVTKKQRRKDDRSAIEEGG